MPFKSKSQARWFYAAESRGELPEGTAERWSEHTKDFKKLPEKVKMKKKPEKMDKGAAANEQKGFREAIDELRNGWEQLMKKTRHQLGERIAALEGAVKGRQVGEQYSPALAGGLLGGLSGLAWSPGTDEETGEQKSRMPAVLGGGLIGAGIGGAGAALSPDLYKSMPSGLTTASGNLGRALGQHANVLAYNMGLNKAGNDESLQRHSANEKTALWPFASAEQKLTAEQKATTQGGNTGATLGKQYLPLMMAGGAIGGLSGLFSDPGYDPYTGRRKSRISAALRNALIGAGIGGVGGFFLPNMHKNMPTSMVNASGNIGRTVGEQAGKLHYNLMKPAQQVEVEKQAFILPATGGGAFKLAPKGNGIGGELGYDYLAGLVPVPNVGIDIGGTNTGLRLSGPIPGIGFRSGFMSRPPGLNYIPSRTRNLYQFISDMASGRDRDDHVAEGYYPARARALQKIPYTDLRQALLQYIGVDENAGMTPAAERVVDKTISELRDPQDFRRELDESRSKDKPKTKVKSKPKSDSKKPNTTKAAAVHAIVNSWLLGRLATVRQTGAKTAADRILLNPKNNSAARIKLAVSLWNAASKWYSGLSPESQAALATGVVKQAYAGNKSINVQQFSPQMESRKLNPEEESAIAAGESQWIPRIFQSYATPVPEMMSSPGKGALLAGGAGLLGGTALGALHGSSVGAPGIGAGLGALGGLGAGGLAALMMYFGRQANNEGLRDLMKRLPPNATKRDLMSDPAYQADLDRSSRSLDMMALGQALAPRSNFMPGRSYSFGKEGMEKSALPELPGANMVREGGGAVLDALMGMPPEAQAALAGGVGGAGLGALTHAMTAKEKNKQRLLGYILGGGALGAGTGLGIQQLKPLLIKEKPAPTPATGMFGWPFKTQAELDKSAAHIPGAGALGALVGSTIRQPIADLIGRLSPEAQAALIGGTGGAGLGALAYAMTPKDENKSGLLGYTLAGGALGAGGGYGLRRFFPQWLGIKGNGDVGGSAGTRENLRKALEKENARHAVSHLSHLQDLINTPVDQPSRLAEAEAVVPTAGKLVVEPPKLEEIRIGKPVDWLPPAAGKLVVEPPKLEEIRIGKPPGK